MTDYPADDDCQRMLLARQGDRAAFETLVRKHQRPLLNYFIRAGVNTDAEDLVQQTFIRLYHYRNRYSARAKFTTFLYLLARQVWIDELRRRNRRQRLRERLTAEPTPEQRVPTPALADDLQQALAGLSERLRAVVTLGVLQELAYPEIAKILKIPVGTVKSRMFNGLRELRARLEALERGAS
jgi:RNA polymerase sigma-70 factor (ECF subfamily)